MRRGLEFTHPVTGKMLELEAPLPVELERFLSRLEGGAAEYPADGLEITWTGCRSAGRD